MIVSEETQKELEKHKKIIINSTNQIIDLLRLEHAKNKQIERQERRKNPYIVKSIIKYMASGLSRENAFIKTALDYQTDVNRIKAIFFEQNRYMSAINLFAKRYACEKLKQAGFKAKEIAKIIGVSENHIYKLLRCKIDFWFLD